MQAPTKLIFLCPSTEEKLTYIAVPTAQCYYFIYCALRNRYGCSAAIIMGPKPIQGLRVPY